MHDTPSIVFDLFSRSLSPSSFFFFFKLLSPSIACSAWLVSHKSILNVVITRPLLLDGDNKHDRYLKVLGMIMNVGGSNAKVLSYEVKW